MTDICYDSDKKYYVYMIINTEWRVPFYIGKGTGGRYKHLKGRSMHVQSILDNYNCESYIITNGLSEEEAYKLEEKYKAEYKNCGAPIIDNERQSLSKMAHSKKIILKKTDANYKEGRPPKYTKKQRDDAYDLMKTHSIRETEEITGISRATLSRIKREKRKCDGIHIK